MTKVADMTRRTVSVPTDRQASLAARAARNDLGVERLLLGAVLDGLAEMVRTAAESDLQSIELAQDHLSNSEWGRRR